MRPALAIAALTLAVMTTAGPASACIIHVTYDPEDVRYADLVVLGRIVNYRIVRDPVAREQRRRMLANAPRSMPAELRRSLETQTDFLSDYARFDVVVEQVLAGRAGRTLSVTWQNSTFGEPPTMGSGQYLIALRNTRSPAPALRGPSATIVPNAEPALPTVLQAPCSDAFIFEAGSREAAAVRERLTRGPAERRP